MRTIALHVHSFSLRYQFRHSALSGGYDVFAYLKEMAALGFTGVNISANGANYRDLGGTTSAHFASVKAEVRRLGLKLELDTSDTRPARMRAMLAVTQACGGDTLRTYTRYGGDAATRMRRTVADLKAIAGEAQDRGITIVLENHEDFTGSQIAEMLAAVDRPSVRALYDYGNSQMVGEDPFDALEAMAPYIARVHVKDHVLTRDADSAPVVQGVAMGDGTLPIAAITERLYELGVRRFCFENVWAYTAPLQCPPGALPDTPCFAFAGPEAYLPGDRLAPAEAVAGERAAFERGLRWFKAMMADKGYAIVAE